MAVVILFLLLTCILHLYCLRHLRKKFSFPHFLYILWVFILWLFYLLYRKVATKYCTEYGTKINNDRFNNNYDKYKTYPTFRIITRNGIWFTTKHSAFIFLFLDIFIVDRVPSLVKKNVHDMRCKKKNINTDYCKA